MKFDKILQRPRRNLIIEVPMKSECLLNFDIKNLLFDFVTHNPIGFHRTQ